MQNPIVQQVIETLRGANNVLITVENSPSIDELTAAIGLTLILNHMNKHATTVFSGNVPSTIEFLQPEMAIETNTDSLRDFIIALDKSKADKLRYKVEDNVVRIFITPYKSSISEEDLEFSQGDFNVDVVVALGIVNKEDFDEAVVAHGSILHDATVVTLSNSVVANEIGAINWQDDQASSISEMVAGVADLFGKDVMDGQIATALLTGIVAQTDRFKNELTTPKALALSSTLMSAGANQKLIAEELEQDTVPMGPIQTHAPLVPEKPAEDGVLAVDHPGGSDPREINIDDNGNYISATDHLDDQQIRSPRNETDGDIREMPSDDNPSASPAASPLEELSDSGNLDDEAEKPAEDDDGHQAAKSREFLSPPPMNLNSDGESPLKEPSEMFGDSMHNVNGGHTIKRPRVINPITHDEPKEDVPMFAPPPIADAPKPPQFTGIPAAGGVPPLPSKPSVAVPGAIQDSSDKEQTLKDIERAVNSPHLAKDAVPPIDVLSNADKKVDDYMGSLKMPNPAVSVPPASPVPEAPPSPAATLPQIQPDLPPIPKVTNPSVAPSVPPPLMPQAAGNQPQFYDSDGSKVDPLS